MKIILIKNMRIFLTNKYYFRKKMYSLWTYILRVGGFFRKSYTKRRNSEHKCVSDLLWKKTPPDHRNYNCSKYKSPINQSRYDGLKYIYSHHGKFTCKYFRLLLATFPWTTLHSPCLNTTRLYCLLELNLGCLYLWTRTKQNNESNVVNLQLEIRQTDGT